MVSCWIEVVYHTRDGLSEKDFQTQKCLESVSSLTLSKHGTNAYITQMLIVWYVRYMYLHLTPNLPKCRYTCHTLSIWVNKDAISKTKKVWCSTYTLLRSFTRHLFSENGSRLLSSSPQAQKIYQSLGINRHILKWLVQITSKTHSPSHPCRVYLPIQLVDLYGKS